MVPKPRKEPSTSPTVTSAKDEIESHVQGMIPKHHAEHLDALIKGNDLEGFLAYISRHNLDINAFTDDPHALRLCERWITHSTESVSVEILQKLMDAGAALDEPGRDLFSYLLLSRDEEILSFLVEAYPHLIPRDGVEAFKLQAYAGSPDIMKKLQEEGVTITPDDFTEKELIAIEQKCWDPECFVILEEAGIRFEKRAVYNAIMHGRLESLAHHARHLPLSELEFDDKDALDIALLSPRTTTRTVAFLLEQGLAIQPKHLQKAKENVAFDGVLTLEGGTEKLHGSASSDGYPFAKEVLNYMRLKSR